MLNVVSVENAIEILNSSFNIKQPNETVDITLAQGRVLAEDIYSQENIPPFNRSAVDGFAVISSDTSGCNDTFPAMLDIKGEVLMGEEAKIGIQSGECVKISTGGMLPLGADSVVMVENTDLDFNDMCLCQKSLYPMENVIKAGEDIKKGDLVLKKGCIIGSCETAVLCALGISKVQCKKMPVAAIISTGDEIVNYDEAPSFGQIRDINSLMLASLLKDAGCIAVNYGIVKDKKEELASVFSRAIEKSDIVILSGGSSAGARDMTADIFSHFGEVLFHGIAMKPGKPTILGKVNSKAVFGLPGNPAAAYFVFLRIVKPYIDMLLEKKQQVKSIMCSLSADIPSNHGREEIIPVKLENAVAYPLYFKSNIISLLSQADGYIIIPRNCEGAFKENKTEVFLLK